MYGFGETEFWLVLYTVIAFIGFCLWISLSKYSKIRFGKNDETPEFSAFLWHAMLFCENY